MEFSFDLLPLTLCSRQAAVEAGTFLPLADAVAGKGILGMFNYSYRVIGTVTFNGEHR